MALSAWSAYQPLGLRRIHALSSIFRNVQRPIFFDSCHQPSSLISVGCFPGAAYSMLMKTRTIHKEPKGELGLTAYCGDMGNSQRPVNPLKGTKCIQQGEGLSDQDLESSGFLDVRNTRTPKCPEESRGGMPIRDVSFSVNLQGVRWWWRIFLEVLPEGG